MVLASEVRRFRLIIAVCLSLLVVSTVATQAAQATPRVPKGGESRIVVSVPAFIKLIQDGIFATPIAPATIQYGSSPTLILPTHNLGLFDASLTTATVPHQGGLHLEKSSINFGLDATNVTLACLPVAGCHVLNTADNLLPNELAELKDVQWSDNGNGTATLTGRALITQVTALALNTLFQSNAFSAGMELGVWTTTINY
jgi:hypothetical protein